MTRHADRLAVFLVAILMLTVPGAAAPVDDVRLLGADKDGSDWLLPGRDYSDRRFSPLDQVGTGNVKNLAPTWIY